MDRALPLPALVPDEQHGPLARTARNEPRSPSASFQFDSRRVDDALIKRYLVLDVLGE